MQITVSPAADLEQLFAANHQENKTLKHPGGGRRRPTQRPVGPFLAVGDVVGFYKGAKDRWEVTESCESFTVLTTVAPDKAGNLQPMYTIISWVDGWRGPHGSWGHSATTPEDRIAMLAALNDGSIEMSIRRAFFLDIKTVRRDGKLIIRKQTPAATSE